MKLYLLSLGAGLLVGLIYSLLHIRSPAPPAIALVGLLGILIGEQALPCAKRLLHASAVHAHSEQDTVRAPAAGNADRPVNARDDRSANR
ncbi:DUF1427 family protein [Paraburkholderia rhizosphaerae]|uniref:XapX domain-containing protein n=1 Tax=Paraburkholderia rhizosphaerae TaxID=480658 RepID=A0A4R8LIJ3_9BURK|nr:DUF1427 family protein [Paraburkholderia rhizosphaerae]TDY43243.1 XapX domain-containing protein [Paraburkholderia rhizosphaerae]